MAMPGWLKKCSQPASLSLSSTPQLLAIATTPGVAAAMSSAAPSAGRSCPPASTRSTLHAGHAAETMSRSREISFAQSASAAGRFLPPVASTLRKQPLALVQGGSP